ncbi:META domain-containing protein [Cerasicoccus frondis]|uniref:META domain-containing protein n=1 Tax=Cerasicoccus frondis TaxID=490090 RepID=UPI002852B83C|nr:META domain-containing protein [Cerasicoccus frondis]
MRKYSVSIVLLVLCLGLWLSSSGCASSKQSATVQGEYTLSSINGKNPELDNVTLKLTNKDIYGNGPINLWQASFEYGKVGPMIVTRRGGPPHEMQFESNLLSSLEGSTLETVEDELIFSKSGSKIIFIKTE